jgi:hypothetical protein
LVAQSKKKMKNKARLPRTAGLRTLTELTTDLTEAGLDPSRIQERAVMIAKMRGAGRKRKRDEDEDGMDVDADADGQDGDNWASEGEDVVGEEGEGGHDTPQKRGKANSGAAIARKRAPRSNRQVAGLRDDAVCSVFFSFLLAEGTDGTPPPFLFFPSYFSFVIRTYVQQASKTIRLRNLGQRKRNMHAKAGESDRAIRVKMVRIFSGLLVFRHPVVSAAVLGSLRSSASLFPPAADTTSHTILPDFSRNISSLGSGREGRPTADKHHLGLRRHLYTPSNSCTSLYPFHDTQHTSCVFYTRSIRRAEIERAKEVCITPKSRLDRAHDAGKSSGAVIGISYALCKLCTVYSTDNKQNPREYSRRKAKERAVASDIRELFG